MTPPKKIEIRKGIIVGGLNVIAELHNAEDMTYFSEDAIRESGFAILDKVCCLLASSHGILINSVGITEDIIRVLKGGENA